MAGAAQTQLEKFKAAIPPAREIHLPLVPDTSNVMAVDVDTDIQGGTKVGWEIYGARYRFQITATGMPIEVDAAADVNWMVQLLRGEAPATPVLQLPSSHDVIMEDGRTFRFSTAVGAESLPAWFEIVRPAVTQFGTLHLVFASDVDIADISVATNELYMELFYRPVNAPVVAMEQL